MMISILKYRIKLAKVDGFGLSRTASKFFKILLVVLALLMALSLLSLAFSSLASSSSFYFFLGVMYILVIPTTLISTLLFAFFGVRVLLLVRRSTRIGTGGNELAKLRVLRNLSILMITCLVGFLVLLGQVSYISLIIVGVASWNDYHPLVNRPLFDYSIIAMLAVVFLALSVKKMDSESKSSHLSTGGKKSTELA